MVERPLGNNYVCVVCHTYADSEKQESYKSAARGQWPRSSIDGRVTVNVLGTALRGGIDGALWMVRIL